jgi:N-acetylglucosaminyldiphosphoundecaprenol N-acetyl-beta-D-mannosaminyltransferase
MIGVGAAFDLYAGDIREAPAIVSRLGLEWMFRLVQEPRRLFSRYLLVNPRFVWLATRQLMRRS